MQESSKPTSEEIPASPVKRRIGKVVDSRLGGVLANLPPISWVIRWITLRVARRRLATRAQSTGRAPSIDLASSLQRIAYDVVETLGYAGAMVATYEQDDSLPVRAFYIDPQIAPIARIRELESEISAQHGVQLSLSDPQIARVYINQVAYRDNLGVQAARTGQPMIGEQLFDLFTPVVPAAARPTIEAVQAAMGIRQVITIPFFIETGQDSGEIKKEYVGNLFAVKCDPITPADVSLLSAFARQMAAAILSERRRLQADLIQELILDIHSGLADEDRILTRIVRGVVSDLGYAGAMVATYEASDALPVRAIYVDPAIASMEQIQRWEQEISEQYSPRPLSLTDPQIARVYVHQEAYQENLSARAAKAGQPVVSNSLFDLFTPIAPSASRPAIEGIQDALGIRQVIAVPFFLETYHAGELQREFVGNLFGATRAEAFKSWEIELLRTFGQQAAAGLKNARLYRQSEDRRVVAQVFGKMAFSATAALHAFRNHLGYMRLSLQLLGEEEIIERMLVDEEARQEICGQIVPGVLARVDQLASILENLHEPFRQAPDELVDVNACLRRAHSRAGVPRPWLRLSLTQAELQANTMPEMLAEAFTVVIKNAVDSVEEKGVLAEEGGDDPLGYIQVQSRLDDGGMIEVVVRDRGVGIPPERLAEVFELGHSTKNTGLGFGLFWARDYLEGLGGGIELESEWGVGTVVRMYLPAAEAS